MRRKWWNLFPDNLSTYCNVIWNWKLVWKPRYKVSGWGTGVRAAAAIARDSRFKSIPSPNFLFLINFSNQFSSCYFRLQLVTLGCQWPMLMAILNLASPQRKWQPRMAEGSAPPRPFWGQLCGEKIWTFFSILMSPKSCSPKTPTMRKFEVKSKSWFGNFQSLI